MARGAEEKQEVINKILEYFPGSFEYDKTIRIPIGDVQIKVTLACAKENVEHGSDTVVPGEVVQTVINTNSVTTELPDPVLATEEEIQNVANLLNSLNL